MAEAVPFPSYLELAAVSCTSCPVGRAAGCERGLFCPLIARDHAAGEVLARAGEPAERIWVVTHGIVGLSRPPHDGAGGPVTALRLPGSLVGVEALDQPTYAATARTLVPTRVCSAPRDAFRAWVGDDADRLALVDHARAAGGEPCR